MLQLGFVNYIQPSTINRYSLLQVICQRLDLKEQNSILGISLILFPQIWGVMSLPGTEDTVYIDGLGLEYLFCFDSKWYVSMESLSGSFYLL